MNFVDLLKGSLTSGDTLGKLGSAVGADAASVQKAVAAGIPAILSGLAGAASTGDGAQKVIDALGKADAGILGKLGGLIGGGSGGGDMLGSILGGGTMSAIAAALSKFSGIGIDGIKKLLAMLGPIVLGGLASQMKGKPLSAAGLTSFFNEQKSNIASALPSGFSLDGIPGLANLGSTARHVAGTATAAAGGGTGLLVPLLLLLLAALGIWYFLIRPRTVDNPNQPPVAVVPDPVNFRTNLTGDFDKLTKILEGVTDAASAEAALPKLKDLSGSLDNLKSLWDKMPAAGKDTIKAFTADNIGKLKDLVAKVLALPGVGDKIKPVVDEIVGKLASFGG